MWTTRFSHLVAATKARISKWLRLPDPNVNFQNAIRSRLLETGEWLLNGCEFASWRDRPGSFLWLQGIRKYIATTQGIDANPYTSWVWKNCYEVGPLTGRIRISHEY